MEVMQAKLLAQLNKGFSHDNLKRLAELCDAFIHDNQSSPATLEAYVISSVCSDLCTRLSDVPIPTGQHDYIRDKIGPSLHGVIEHFASGDPAMRVSTLVDLISTLERL